MRIEFDYESAVKENNLKYFKFAIYITIILNILSILYYLFNIAIDIRIGILKKNIIRLHHMIYISCPIASIVVIIQKFLLLFQLPEGLDHNNSIFLLLSYFRTATILPASICLSAFMIERFFATWLRKDYESKDRPFIGYSIGIALYIASGILAYLATIVKTSIYHVIALFSLSFISCSGNYINFRINLRYYKNIQSNGTYSLTERYQISDNIHFYNFFNIKATSIGLFSTLCPLFIFLSDLSSSAFYRNLYVTLFDIFFALYTTITPFIAYKYNKRWMEEFRGILGTKICKSSVGYIGNGLISNSTSLRDTFGTEMNIEVGKQSDLYFTQLNSSWSRFT